MYGNHIRVTLCKALMRSFYVLRLISLLKRELDLHASLLNVVIDWWENVRGNQLVE